MNYRTMSDKEVVAQAETFSVIPQDLAQEMLYRLRRSGNKGEREGPLIIATSALAGMANPLPHKTYTGRLSDVRK